MSLDVYLTGEKKTVMCTHCLHDHEEREELYWANITHNLTDMAREAGIYYALWRPEETGITVAKQLIPRLKHGLRVLESDPVRFSKFNAPNGWGSYKHFVPFVKGYLDACIEYPSAIVNVSK